MNIFHNVPPGLNRRSVAAVGLAMTLAGCSSASSTATIEDTIADTTEFGTSLPNGAESSSDTTSDDVTQFPPTEAAVVFPIAPGEVDNWQGALADLIGPRYQEYSDSRERFGLDQQTTVLQRTPMGDFALIYMEGDDLNETAEVMATSPTEWDVQWRQMTTGLHGTDFNDADNLVFDVHMVLDTGNISEIEKRDTTPFNFFVPLADGTIPDMKDQFEDVMTNRSEEYRAARSSIGIAEEKVFLQNTPVGPGLVVYWEADDPSASFEQLLTSDDPFDLWFQSQFGNNHAVPVDVLSTIIRDNKLVADFPARDT